MVKVTMEIRDWTCENCEEEIKNGEAVEAYIRWIY